MLTVVLILLAVYFILDSYYYRKEGATAPEEEAKTPLRLEGIYNFIFLAGIIGSVLMSGIVEWGEVKTLGIHRPVQDWVRDGLLVFMGILSLIATPIRLR